MHTSIYPTIQSINSHFAISWGFLGERPLSSSQWGETISGEASLFLYMYFFLRFDLIVSIKFCPWKLGCYSKNDMVQFYFARSLHVRRVFWVFSQVYQPNNSSRVKEQQNLILAKLFEMGNNFEILQKTKRKVWKSMYLIGNSKTRFFLAYSV